MGMKNKLLFWLLLPQGFIIIAFTVVLFFADQGTIKQNITNQTAIADDLLQKGVSASLEGEKGADKHFRSNIHTSGLFATPVPLRNFLLAMGVVGIISAMVAITISRRVSRSLQIITEGTKKIARGDFGDPISIDTLEGKMRVIGESLNSMMNTLRETEAKNREVFLQVKRGRDEWQETFDSITDIITIIDKDFRIIRANKTFFENFNSDKTRLREKKCFETFHDADSPPANCPLIQCFKNMKTVYEEMVFANMEGIFLVTAFPLFDEKGEIYGAVQQAKDITFQKKLLKELMKKANKLDEANGELERLTRIVSELT